uniref:G_PROTEIN_RECEP_F1_2 domain-containing protein n=1 Tax=Haemonchus contortus TaxID=6289 RepID=A0A7I4YQK3_HAECO
MTNTSIGGMALFSINPKGEEATIGIVYSSLALFIAPLYSVVIYVMTKDKELRSSPQYRLMNQINFLDFGQVICHVLSGIFIIFPQIQQRLPALVRIFGCTANSLWLALFPVMSVLAISRILVIRRVIQPKEIPLALKVVMVIGWMYSIGVWLWGCITQNFYLTGVGWSYDLSKMGAKTLSALEWYLCFPSLGLTYIAYLAIVIHVEMTRRDMTTNTNRRGQEIKIFLQATILFCYMSTLIILWHNAVDWFHMTSTTIAILNSAWIFFSYLNPLLLLAMNHTIRKKVMVIFKGYSREGFTGSVFFINLSKTRPPSITPG